MIKTSMAALLAPLVLCGLAQQDHAPDTVASQAAYTVQCEVWLASDPGLISAIESQAPNLAESVLQSLQGAEQGSRRLVRVLAPIHVGSTARFENSVEMPTVSVTTSGQGRTQQNFAGYTANDTTVVLGCRPGSSKGAVTTSLDLEVQIGVDDQGGASIPSIPPKRTSFNIQCQGTSPSGELGMLQFQTGESGMLTVFMRATAR